MSEEVSDFPEKISVQANEWKYRVQCKASLIAAGFLEEVLPGAIPEGFFDGKRRIVNKLQPISVGI